MERPLRLLSIGCRSSRVGARLRADAQVDARDPPDSPTRLSPPPPSCLPDRPLPFARSPSAPGRCSRPPRLPTRPIGSWGARTLPLDRRRRQTLFFLNADAPSCSAATPGLAHSSSASASAASGAAPRRGRRRRAIADGRRATRGRPRALVDLCKGGRVLASPCESRMRSGVSGDTDRRAPTRALRAVRPRPACRGFFRIGAATGGGARRAEQPARRASPGRPHFFSPRRHPASASPIVSRRESFGEVGFSEAARSASCSRARVARRSPAFLPRFPLRPAARDGGAVRPRACARLRVFGMFGDTRLSPTKMSEVQRELSRNDYEDPGARPSSRAALARPQPQRRRSPCRLRSGTPPSPPPRRTRAREREKKKKVTAPPPLPPANLAGCDARWSGAIRLLCRFFGSVSRSTRRGERLRRSAGGWLLWWRAAPLGRAGRPGEVVERSGGKGGGEGRGGDVRDRTASWGWRSGRDGGRGGSRGARGARWGLRQDGPGVAREAAWAGRGRGRRRTPAEVAASEAARGRGRGDGGGGRARLRGASRDGMATGMRSAVVRRGGGEGGKGRGGEGRAACAPRSRSSAGCGPRAF